MNQKFSFSKVSLNLIETPINGEFSDKIYRKCSFCEKEVLITDNNSEILNKLSGPNGFYCSFCLRNNFNTKITKDILILSFRGIIANLYYQNYLTDRKIWFSELENIILVHKNTGLKNPVFKYDLDSFLWFVDFSKVGNTKKKISIIEVYKTIIEILLCFNFWEYFSGYQVTCYNKFKEAIEKFYENRFRPDDRKMLIPTLNSKFSLEKLKNFTSNELFLKK